MRSTALLRRSIFVQFSAIALFAHVLKSSANLELGLGVECYKAPWPKLLKEKSTYLYLAEYCHSWGRALVDATYDL